MTMPSFHDSGCDEVSWGPSEMHCTSCGMAIQGKGIREEIEGTVNYYCCTGCLHDELCRRDKPLRRALKRTPRGTDALRVRSRRS